MEPKESDPWYDVLLRNSAKAVGALINIVISHYVMRYRPITVRLKLITSRKDTWLGRFLRRHKNLCLKLAPTAWPIQHARTEISREFSTRRGRDFYCEL